MQLCFSCRNPFPPSLLEPLPLDEKLAKKLGALTDALADMKGQLPPQSKDTLNHAQNLVQELTFLLLEKRGADEHLPRVASLKLRGASWRQNSIGVDAGNELSQAGYSARGTQSKGITGGSMLPSASSTYRPTSGPHGGGGNNGIPQKAAMGSSATGPLGFEGSFGFSSTIGSTSGPHTSPLTAPVAMSPESLVSASIYSVLESLAVRSRAEYAILWLKPRSEIFIELVAPFIVGKIVAMTGAPLRTSSPSTPFVVADSGVAVNMGPSLTLGSNDTSLQRRNMNLVHIVENCMGASLVVPIFSRYGEIARSTIGAIQLIGSLNCPVAFTRVNEQNAAQAADCLSVIISAYSDTMLQDWVNHVYDPSAMTRAATYNGYLDQRSDEKALDDFSLPTLLVLRCDNTHDQGTDKREAGKRLRAALRNHTVAAQPVTRLKELHRHALTMEDNWVAAVRKNVTLEHRLNELTAQLKVLKRADENGMYGEPSPPLNPTAQSSTPNANAASVRASQRTNQTTREGVDGTGTGVAKRAADGRPMSGSSQKSESHVPRQVPRAPTTMNSDEVNQLESETLKRVALLKK